MSPSGDPTLHSLTSHIAWHLQRGATPREAELQARTFLPGMADDLYRTALREAQYGVATAERANLLAGNEPLSNALLGLPQPDDTVTVRVLASLPGPTGQISSVSLRVNVPWGATMDEVEEAWRQQWDEMRAMSVGLAPDYGEAAADEGWTIMGPLRFRDR